MNINEYKKPFEKLYEHFTVSKSGEGMDAVTSDLLTNLEKIRELVNKETPKNVICIPYERRRRYRFICPKCKEFLFSANNQTIRIMKYLGSSDNYNFCAY